MNATASIVSRAWSLCARYKAFCGQLVPQDKNDEPAAALLERIRAEDANGIKKPGRKGKIS